MMPEAYARDLLRTCDGSQCHHCIQPIRSNELVAMVRNGDLTPYIYHARCLYSDDEWRYLKNACSEGEILEVKLPDRILMPMKNLASANICATIGIQGTQA